MVNVMVTNESLGIFMITMLVYAFGMIIFKLIEMIDYENKMNKKRDAEAKALPYKREYERLLSEEKFKEASDFSKKYEKHMANSYYYW